MNRALKFTTSLSKPLKKSKLTNQLTHQTLKTPPKMAMMAI